MEARLTVTPEQITEQLQLLRTRSIQTVFMREIPTLLKTCSATQTIALTFDDGYQDFYTNMLPILKSEQVKATLYIPTGFIGKKGYLTWNQLAEIRDSGLVEIAAHSISHPNMAILDTPHTMHEIVGSVGAIMAHLSIQVYSFAYPSGQYTVTTEQSLRKVGLQSSVTTKFGIADEQADLFALPRFRAGQMSFAAFKKFVALHYQNIGLSLKQNNVRPIR